MIFRHSLQSIPNLDAWKIRALALRSLEEVCYVNSMRCNQYSAVLRTAILGVGHLRFPPSSTFGAGFPPPFL